MESAWSLTKELSPCGELGELVLHLHEYVCVCDLSNSVEGAPFRLGWVRIQEGFTREDPWLMIFVE